jgi:ArsR family transcriptional regulator
MPHIPVESLPPAPPATWLSAIGEASRLAIIRTLATGPRNVTDLAKALGVEPMNVSHHLRMLKNAGLISVEQRGKYLWYALVGANAAGAVLELAHPSGVKVTLPLAD